MTIDEMRGLHQRALAEAEAKRTELRLVLASRYRELVGSSDEVIKMKERAQELHDLVGALPTLMAKLNGPVMVKDTAPGEEKETDEQRMNALRRHLSNLPRAIYRVLDSNDVYAATSKLIELFTLIASQTNVYRLANVLSSTTLAGPPSSQLDPALDAQMRMIFLQVQTLPKKIARIAGRNLVQAASYGKAIEDPALGAEVSAAALASLDLLDVEKKENRASHLLELYFDAKAKLLVSLLNKLSTSSGPDNEAVAAGNAEDILSKIVLILQYDIILHPYQIFVVRQFRTKRTNAEAIMHSLPTFDRTMVRAKCSKFLAAHLPLIRTKVKSVLVTIAGTTASALGQIRQSLYDKTDDAGCLQRLDDNGVCTWDEAVDGLIDVRQALSSADTTPTSVGQRKFSLWGVLFSNTFSSLVHSLLTTAFQSVHTKVVSTLRASLANAPPLAGIFPHEAYRNTLQIATELNQALLKVSDDAHELLVHAEERIESERRLRQSLYVQTCEIMGRLVCELRRMVHRGNNDKSDATKELIVGRLCYLLKFRLTSLATLLDPSSSPSAMHSTSGMIAFVDLQSAFELADDNEDGLISFDEAMEAVESAFSGTQFRGAEMVRETLLLTNDGKAGVSSAGSDLVTNVSLNELALLAARGLRHEASGQGSALGAVQQSLDSIVEKCFTEWSRAALEDSNAAFDAKLTDFLSTASSVSEAEWLRLHPVEATLSGPKVENISPFVVGFVLNVSSALNQATCPSDSLTPVPSLEYASSLGIVEGSSIPTLTDTMRWSLLRQAVLSLAAILEAKSIGSLNKCGITSLVQHQLDVSFLGRCFFERNQYGFAQQGGSDKLVAARKEIEGYIGKSHDVLRSNCDRVLFQGLASFFDERQKRVFEISDLAISSLFGEDAASATVSAAGELDLGASDSSAPLFQSPLSSTRRFVLLPVQADRTLNEIQLRSKYAKEKEAAVSRPDRTGPSVMSTGLGFFSNILKKN